jgi:hypothetical protein
LMQSYIVSHPYFVSVVKVICIETEIDCGYCYDFADNQRSMSARFFDLISFGAQLW